jgi:hypothetical protein
MSGVQFIRRHLFRFSFSMDTVVRNPLRFRFRNECEMNAKDCASTVTSRAPIQLLGGPPEFESRPTAFHQHQDNIMVRVSSLFR